VSILNDYNESLANADITPGSLSDAKDRLNGLSESLSAAVFDYNTQLRNSERRIEFIRSEVLFELQAAMVKASIRKAAGEGAVSERTVRNPKIINSQKVAEYREKGLRLNVGCGHIQPDGYLNVDAREIPGIDVIAEATNIPFNEGEVTEIFSSHLIEHFTENILKNVVLPHWHTLLKSGGTLTTVAPDGAEMLNAISKRDMSFADFREVLFGSQDYGGDFHYNLIIPDSFRNYLEDAGFVDVIVDYLGRRNGKCFEFKIAARKL
jgi:predicted SAM-dependent methyltransferase